MKNLLKLLEELKVKLELANGELLEAEELTSDADMAQGELDDEEEHKEEAYDVVDELNQVVSAMNSEIYDALELLENFITKIKGE
jgi:hypothetical protein